MVLMIASSGDPQLSIAVVVSSSESGVEVEVEKESVESKRDAPTKKMNYLTLDGSMVLPSH